MKKATASNCKICRCVCLASCEWFFISFHFISFHFIHTHTHRMYKNQTNSQNLLKKIDMFNFFFVWFQYENLFFPFGIFEKFWRFLIFVFLLIFVGFFYCKFGNTLSMMWFAHIHKILFCNILARQGDSQICQVWFISRRFRRTRTQIWIIEPERESSITAIVYFSIAPSKASNTHIWSRGFTVIWFLYRSLPGFFACRCVIYFRKKSSSSNTNERRSF